MKRYYFQLLDAEYNDLGALIPDGSDKQVAINRAKRYMRENGIKAAQLSINSMRTDNILDIVEIEL